MGGLWEGMGGGEAVRGRRPGFWRAAGLVVGVLACMRAPFLSAVICVHPRFIFLFCFLGVVPSSWGKEDYFNLRRTQMRKNVCHWRAGGHWMFPKTVELRNLRRTLVEPVAVQLIELARAKRIGNQR